TTINNEGETANGHTLNVPFNGKTHTTTVRDVDINSTEVGITFYDLQTNAAVCRRLSDNGDGTISAIWTMSQSTRPWNDRGTGYNYFDGTTWLGEPTITIEGSTRTGFNSIAVTPDGAEHVLSHATAINAGEPFFSQRPVKGTGTWNNTA